LHFYCDVFHWFWLTFDKVLAVTAGPLIWATLL
jgi:hypothetical protein